MAYVTVFKKAHKSQHQQRELLTNLTKTFLELLFCTFLNINKIFFLF